MIAAREALRSDGRELAGTRFAIQGFGNVGSWLAYLLHERDAKVVAVSDVHGGVFRGDGLDIPGLFKHKDETGSVVNFPHSEPISNEALLTSDCDVLVPAALGHVLTADNARDVRARYILEAANSPTACEADAIFNERNIVCLPDIWVNAGGVTVSYFEWTQNTQKLKWHDDQVNRELEKHMLDAYQAIRMVQRQYSCSLRAAAFILAIQRVKAATDARGLG
jgi:glutamate dehydrogenase (NAD(P)+)